MKIRGKLFLGFFLLLAVTVFIAVFGAFQIASVSGAYEHAMNYPLVRRSILSRMEVAMMDARRTMNRASMHASDVYGDGSNEAANAAYRDIGITNQETLIIALRAELLNYLADYRASLASDNHISDQARAEVTPLLDGLEESMMHYIDYYILDRIMTAARAGDTATAVSVTTAAGGAGGTVPVIYYYFDEIRAIINSGMTTTEADLRRTTNTTFFSMLILAAISVVLGAAIALIISSMVSKPITEVAKVVSSVSNGDFNINFRNNNSTDEVGVMTQDVYNLVGVVRGMVDDISNFAHEVDVNGDIEYRVDPSKYKGGYRDMIISLNSLSGNFARDLMTILEVLNNVNKGDFTAELKKLPGKKVVLNNTVDELIANLNSVSSEVSAMIEAVAVKGDLNFTINTDKYNGDWQKIMHGLNDIAVAVQIPLQTIKMSLDTMRAGDFNLAELDKRIAARGLESDSEKYYGDFKAVIIAIDATMTDIHSYINELEQVLAKMADGDLRNEIKREYVGSFDAIKRSVNNINRTLHQTMTEISVAADQVLSGANQISTSATDLASGAQQQASSVQELNASIDIINQQTGKNAESAFIANELSNKSSADAQEGNSAMKQTVEAMSQIKESSNNISKIIKTIQDIAFQTNLLALNASVEAARAGEHGKGFAVVADEVRTLAGRSQDAANETTTLIQDSINRVESGSSIAETTSKSLDAIVASSSEVSDIIESISTASKEQAEAVGQISVGLEQISSVTQSNSAVSEETAAAAQELNSQAEMLRQLVAYFKL